MKTVRRPRDCIAAAFALLASSTLWPSTAGAQGYGGQGQYGGGYGGQNQNGGNYGGQGQNGTAAQSFADEDRDFGVPARDELQSNVGSPTPLQLPGGGVITTVQLANNIRSGKLVVIDAWDDTTHPHIAGSVFLPYAGAPGRFGDQASQRLGRDLPQLTRGDQQAILVFYCAGPICWESYNAALRAIHLGYRNVLWYRGGLAAWRQAGLPVSSGGQAPGPLPVPDGADARRLPPALPTTAGGPGPVSPGPPPPGRPSGQNDDEWPPAAPKP